MKRLIYVSIIVISCFESPIVYSSDNSRRNSAKQSLGALRKAQEMYFSENEKYTPNVENLMQYTNVTSLLYAFENNKVKIEITDDLKSYTMTGTARDRLKCPVVATGGSIPENVFETEECLGKRKREEFLVLAKHMLFLIGCFILPVLLTARFQQFNGYLSRFIQAYFIGAFAVVLCLYLMLLFSSRLRSPWVLTIPLFLSYFVPKVFLEFFHIPNHIKSNIITWSIIALFLGLFFFLVYVPNVMTP